MATVPIPDDAIDLAIEDHDGDALYLNVKPEYDYAVIVTTENGCGLTPDDADALADKLIEFAHRVRRGR